MKENEDAIKELIGVVKKLIDLVEKLQADQPKPQFIYVYPPYLTYPTYPYCPPIGEGWTGTKITWDINAQDPLSFLESNYATA